MRVGNWKGIRPNVAAHPRGPDGIELYDLAKDPKEEHNVAAENPEIVAKIAKIMQEQHVKSEAFPLRGVDAGVADAPAPKKKKKG